MPIFLLPSPVPCTEQVLTRLSFNKVNKWIPVIVLVAIMIFFQILAFLILALNGTKFMTMAAPPSEKKGTLQTAVVAVS